MAIILTQEKNYDGHHFDATGGEHEFTTKSGRRRKLCEDYKKALTSELAAKRMKTVNQLARIDGVDTKRLRETLSKEMLTCQWSGFRTFHVVSSVARKMAPA